MKHGIRAWLFAVLMCSSACGRGVTTPTTPTITPAPAPVPPSGPSVLAGAVQEPGQGPVSGVSVTDTASTVSTQTDSLGHYSLTVPSGNPNPAHLRFEKDGFEPVELDQFVTSTGDARIQKIIRLVAGETVSPDRLAPNDLSYDVGGARCSSCRLIRIVVPAAGTLHLVLTWPPTTTGVTLGLWIGGRHIFPKAGTLETDADVPAEAGELIIYADRVSPATTTDHVIFTLTTSLTS